MKHSSLVLMLKSSIKILINNKIRFILTIIGIGVGLFILAVAIELINVYSEKEYSKIKKMDSNTCMIYSQNYIDIGETLYKMDQSQCEFSYVYYKKSKDESTISHTYKNSVISTNLCLMGASYDFQNGYYCCNDDSMNYMSNIKVLYGKSFSKEQYENNDAVCVLEKSTSELVYGKENSVGKDLLLEIEGITYQFKVVAVIDDFPMTTESNLKINSGIRFGEDVIVQRNIIVPLCWYNKHYENSDRSLTYVIFNFENESLNKGINIIENSNYETDNVEIVDYKKLAVELDDEVVNLQILVNIILLCVFILSGLVVMNTMFFSIKERIRELGIRRALGANSIKIFEQIVFESVIQGCVSYLLTIILLNVVFAVLSIVMLYILGIDYIIYLHTKTYGIIFVIGVIESISFSILPAIYAARINTREAVEFN